MTPKSADHILIVDDDREIIAELIASMQKTPAGTEAGLSLFSATRHLERIADHATNIAEDVIFMVSARDVRHHAGDPT